MTNLDELMATEVMGWKNAGDWFNEGIDYLMGYGTDSLFTGMKLADWHPTTDIGQAIMCATKYCDDNICVLSTQYDPTRKLWWADITDGNDGIDGESNKDNLSLAICEAIKQAVEK